MTAHAAEEMAEDDLTIIDIGPSRYSGRHGLQIAVL
jgi:hypothetical protein